MYFFVRNVAKYVHQKAPLYFDTKKSIVETMKENIIAEKLYEDEIDSVVKNILTTEALLENGKNRVNLFLKYI